MAQEKKEAHIKIHGRVQGVGFRYSLVEKAEKLNIKGWCHNSPDGAVECVATGPKDNLDLFIEWCHDGPRFAKVKEVQVKWKEAAENFDSFEVK